MTSSPIAYRVTDDGTLQPLPRFRRQFDETFVCQATYILEMREERSTKSHAHFFAQLADAWGTLPAAYDGRFPRPEHLRAYLLIKAGYCNHVQHPCETKAEAMRTRALAAGMNEYAIVTVTDRVVNVFTAQSMSYRAMDRKTFQHAKDAMLGLLDDMLGVGRGDVDQHSARAA